MSRVDRVASEIKQYVCEILQHKIKDPRIGFVTITDVEVTPDLQKALVYYSVLGDEKQKQASQEAIKNARSFIRKELAERMNMRYTPVLDFRIDESAEYGQKIDDIFRKINSQKKEA